MFSFRKCTSATVAALTILSMTACSKNEAQKQSGQQTPATGLVQKVNGSPITKAELDRAVKALLAQSRAPENLPPEALKQATDAALNQLTSAELLYQAASKVEVKDLDKQVSAKIVQTKYQYPSQAEFDKALQSIGMTQKEMEEAARKDIVINSFIEKQFSSLATVSEDEVKKFYDDNRDKAFSHGEQIKVSHILIPVPAKATPEAKKQAKEKAVALLQKVKGGADFAALAKEESASPTKAQGGDLGIIARGQAVPSFEKAAFALKAGAVSDVVETEFGYHLIKVSQKLAPSTDKFADVKSKIVVFLKREKVRKAVAQYVDQLRSKAKIEKA